jgi:hypothetical protein
MMAVTILPNVGNYLPVEHFYVIENLNLQRYRCNNFKSSKHPWSLKAGDGVETHLIVHSADRSNNWRYMYNFSVEFKIEVRVFPFVKEAT